MLVELLAAAFFSSWANLLGGLPSKNIKDNKGGRAERKKIGGGRTGEQQAGGPKQNRRRGLCTILSTW